MKKIALVTGASAGFGLSIVTELVKEGYRVIGAARRMSILKSLEEQFGSSHFFPLEMDVSKTNSIDEALAKLPKEWQEIDVLINNAGLALGLDKAFEADFSN